ncbi:ZIP family metal transporter [Sporolactobacillus kofuensis]|uniref:ZIP family metal transporter n=1 Tax=Sporolactobacillus kofuensis TaxID=269672 RepID=A0ABW1WEN4_9BACL|nr:ZIP family metal transporter [Sporolactobacillus kofuensis]MCO7175744.1 ZIP family metal transporter [Sporolactobacillus kofuensis]
MLHQLSTLHPVLLALFAGLFTWGCTAAGAALVFFFKQLNQKMANVMFGFAAGVMIAASFWSLLAPALELSSGMGTFSFIPALVGFLLGGVFLRIVDRLIPHLHLGFPVAEKEGPKTKLHKIILLVFSITIHNIPEGAAVGVAFGAVIAGNTELLVAALTLAFGIGIQNFPEGAAVAIPLRGEGLTRWKSFWYGQLSAIVEPIFAVIGAYLVVHVSPILPYALAFAAGAMIFVVIEELIPESQREGSTDLATTATMIGFAVMMVLDVALG